MRTLAMLYDTTGKYSEAESLFKECLETKRDVLGDSHTNALVSINNLALLYKKIGRCADAEPLYADCLEKRRAVLGESHLDTLTSINNLAARLCSMARYSRSRAAV